MNDPTSTAPIVTLMAAVARNGVIGDGQRLPWRLSEDLQFLKQTTIGHVVVMGRKTWDSLPPRFRPLPERRNIVVTRDPAWSAAGAEAADSLEAAVSLVGDAEEVFVLGGAQLYALALPLAQRLLLTEIEHAFDGDTRFPEWNRQDFTELWRSHHDSGQGWAYQRALYQRSAPR
ncbi:MAG: dihydrofolate reductase [Rubrivivax sp.]